MLLSLETSLNSFSSIVGHIWRKDLFSSWTMHFSTTPAGLRTCTLKQESSCFTYHHTHPHQSQQSGFGGFACSVILRLLHLGAFKSPLINQMILGVHIHSQWGRVRRRLTQKGNSAAAQSINGSKSKKLSHNLAQLSGNCALPYSWNSF